LKIAKGCAGAALVLLLAACGQSGASDRTADAAAASGPATGLGVTVQAAERSAMASRVTATGTVAAWQELVLGARISGLALVDVRVGEGDRVEAGQVLALLDDSGLTAEKAQQKAAVEEAEANLANALLAEERSRKLAATNAVSRETVDERATATRTARAKLAQAKAALDLLDVKLGQTRVTAPVSGTIAAKPAVLGVVVQTGTELFRILRDDRLEVEALVPERDMPAVEPGQAATVTDAAGGTIRAEVRATAAKVDPLTRLGTAYLTLPDDAGLLQGMFVRVTIQAGERMVLSVAEQSLVWRDGQPAVFTVGADGTVELRTVETGARAGGRVAIVSGLAGGESVVVAGAGFLDDGNVVRVVTQQADAGEGAP
jgi:RND family efflux transporter MFP subunit